MKNYKLICSDIDGTLLNKERCLSIETIKQFNRVSALGVPIVLSSSRMPKSIRSILSEAGLNQAIIAYNGALIETSLDMKGNSSIVYDEPIPLKHSERISKLCLELDIHCSLYNKDFWFPSKEDSWTDREIRNTRIKPIITQYEEIFNIAPAIKGFHKIMCMGEESKITYLFQRLHQEFQTAVEIYPTKTTYIEISPKASNKSKALATLCNYLNININDVISFGDNYNDVEMIKHSGMGIAVENAVHEVKRVADDITAKNTEDGVAKALDKYIK